MTTELWMRIDIRGAGIAASSPELCAAAIDQAVWADENGFDAILFAEHHGTADGYLPSPMIMAAAVAARTKRIRLQLGALILPLSNPLRIAEDVAVLDNISNGRVDITVGVGYVPSEFAMMGVDMKKRPSLTEEGITTLRRAFTGEPFEFRGRKVRVTPKPVQPGGPEIMHAGAVPASALRAARFCDGFFPTVVTPELLAIYRDECARVGKPVGRIVDMTGPSSIHVSHNPERDWPRVAPHMMHEINTYGRWSRESGTLTNYTFPEAKDIAGLKAIGAHHVFTPDECLAFLQNKRANNTSFLFNPLCGGIHPDIAWESLRLMEHEVLPRFKHVPVSRGNQRNNS